MNRHTSLPLNRLFLCLAACALLLAAGCARTPETFPGDPQLPEEQLDRPEDRQK